MRRYKSPFFNRMEFATANIFAFTELSAGLFVLLVPYGMFHAARHDCLRSGLCAGWWGSRLVADEGKIIYCLLVTKRDMAVAMRFFVKAIGANSNLDKVVMDMSSTKKAAIMSVNAAPGKPILVPQTKYHNNIVKQVTRLMFNFQ